MTVDANAFRADIAGRAKTHFDAAHQANMRSTDRLMAALMAVQWLGCVATALIVTPRTWIGAQSAVHIHVMAAGAGGALLAALPIWLALRNPGGRLTRHVIAAAQVLFSSLVIHLTGGRIESHFHVFGSLAFLAFYRDWQVLLTATAVVAIDHAVRGTFYPQSVFGVLVSSHWRWIEHAGWVLFEDVILVWGCRRGLHEMRQLATNRAELESAKDDVEDEVRRQTFELVNARTAAEAASRAKSEFLANMSHEIRTPMTAILGYADLMVDPEQSAEDRMAGAHVIRRNGEHLLAVINDILDLSKIEAGRMSVERIACDPSRIVAEVVSLMRVRAAERGLVFEVEFQGPVPLTIRTDPTRLRQILMNLAGNAVKFTEAGGVRIVIRLDPPETSPRRLWFDMIDTGIGMTAEQMHGLFNHFAQADASMTRRFGGTGLGLSLSKQFAAMLGGGITASSEPGHGSTFTLSIETGPLDDAAVLDHPAEPPARPGAVVARPPALVEKESAASPLSGLLILLAEDGPDNQRLIRFLLEKAGAAVQVVENGAVAMDAVAAAESDHPFDVVLMDMQMPVMDGYSAAAALRSRGCRTPIIALTAHSMSGDREKCLQAGCDDYATKPIVRATLLQAILRAASRDGQVRGSKALKAVA